MTASTLLCPELAGPYRITPAQRETLLAQAEALTWPSYLFCAAGEGWLARLGGTLGFPDYFGANFDALYDCLCDPAILPHAACVLVLTDTQALPEEELDILIAVLQAASDEWRAGGRAFWSLFDSRSVDLDPFPVKQP